MQKILFGTNSPWIRDIRGYVAVYTPVFAPCVGIDGILAGTCAEGKVPRIEDVKVSHWIFNAY